MNKDKNKKKPLSDEKICDVISQAISDVINMSKNDTFKRQCCEILQVGGTTIDIKDKLNKHFSRFMKQKRAPSIDDFFDINEPEEKDVSIEALIKNMENTHINVVEELDGFDNWEACLTQNE